MDRREFCRTALAAGMAAAYPLLLACERSTPVAKTADTSIGAISLDGVEIEIERAAI